jgi:hypothetical protein
MRTTLPVQCCCEPGVRLGWIVTNMRVDRPAALHFGRVVGPRGRLLEIGPPEKSTVSYIRTEAKWHTSMPYPAVPYICEAGEVHNTVPLKLTRLAISSHEHPLEHWLEVPGFVAGQRRPRRL